MALAFAVPPVVGCMRGPGGLAACFTPAPDAPQPPEAALPATQPPSEPPTSPEAEAAIEEAIAEGGTAITLLRAEPDGNVVIAGSGKPASEVAVYANGDRLGTAVTAETTGDWVLVPERPLPAGGVEITVGEAGAAARTDHSFVVVIDPERMAEPLVVATTPGEASRVLQGLPVIDTLPAAAPGAAIESVSQPAVLGEMSEAAPAPVSSASEPETESAAEPESEADAAPEDGSEVQAAPEDEPETLAEPESGEAAPEPQATLVQPESDAVAGAPMVTAAIELDEPTPMTPLAEETAPLAAAPSIDAVEIDGEANFIAGAGPEGATMRLYVDDSFVADATVEGGRWLVEAEDVLDKPAQRIRVDMLKPGTADVSARAEVNFVIELPPLSEPSDRSLEAAAEAVPTAQPDRDLAAAAEANPVAPTSRDLAATAEADPVAAPGRDLATAAEASPAALPGRALAPAPDAAPKAGAGRDLSATADGMPAVPAGRDMATAPSAAQAAAPEGRDIASPPRSATGAGEAPILGQTPKEAANSVASAPAEVSDPPSATAMSAEAETVPDDTLPTLTAVPLGDPEARRFASGKAIIRRGDNLWSIARRVYGRGIRYTTIYQANRDQIRNPRWIYPGQVFDLPRTAD